MNTTGLFDTDQPFTVITKDRIETFLPGLWDEVFKIPTPSPITESVTSFSTSSVVDIPSNESSSSKSVCLFLFLFYFDFVLDETNNEPIPSTNVRYIFLPDKFLGRKGR